MEPLISVIVPVYNVEAYLHRCVQSIVKQTYRNLEILLVDDGSTDRSGQICDELEKTDARLRVIHQKNGGLSAARNRGIEEAHGAYIAFVDSDDSIDADMYRTMLVKLQEQNADMAVCGYSKRLEEENRIVESGVGLAESVLQGNDMFDLLFREDLSVWMPVAWNKLYRKEIWDNLRYPVGRYHEDEHVIHHLLNRCKTVVTMPDALYVYSIRSGSIMTSRTLKASRDWIDALLDRLDLYEKTGLDALAQKQRERCIRMMLWECKKIEEIRRQEQEFIREMARLVKQLRKGHKVNGSFGAKVFARAPLIYIKISKKML